MSTIRALAAPQAHAKLEAFTYDPGPLGDEKVLLVVGVVPAPMAVAAFPLIAGQRSVGGSPSGAPATVASMLEFCARHGIRPVTEEFPMSRANEAMAHLAAGKARYRIVSY